MGIGEFPALGGETIDARGFEFRGTIATEIAVAKVICEDENNVGFFCSGGGMAYTHHADGESYGVEKRFHASRVMDALVLLFSPNRGGANEGQLASGMGNTIGAGHAWFL